MQGSESLRIAIVSPGDRDQRATAAGADGRFADLFEALKAAGHHAEPAIYHDDFRDEVRDQLFETDVVLVWVNPIHDGRSRALLDDMLREVATNAVLVSAHPDVILKIGTKQVLYDTRELGWGSSTELYRGAGDLIEGLAERLPDGARVVKQHRGSSGDGVYRIELTHDYQDSVNNESLVKVRHAKRGSTDELMTLREFCDQCAHFFADDAVVIDQEFLPRVAEGMIRCYLVQGQVAGFGHQAVNALIPAALGGEAPMPGPRLYHPPTMSEYQALKSTLENDWIPALLQLLDVEEHALPMLWDCDFLLGPTDDNGDDTFVLCEINASSVAPYPSSVVPEIVNAITAYATR